MKKVTLLLSIISLISCQDNTDIIENPADGTIKSYSEGIVNDGYSSSIIYYPSDIKAQTPVVVVMHGWLGNKEKMAWIGKLVAKENFVAMVVSAKNYKNFFATPMHWIKNYKVAISSIKKENERGDSPIFNMINTNKISIVGHSMGAGGALYYSDIPEIDAVKSVVALAPYSLTKKPGKNITSNTLVIAGKKDLLATVSMTGNFYKALNSAIKKDYVLYDNVGHNDFEKGGKYHDEIGSNIVNWLNQYGK